MPQGEACGALKLHVDELMGGLPLFTEKKTEKNSSRKLADQALVL